MTTWRRPDFRVRSLRRDRLGGPRTLLWVTVKRDNPTMRDLYGHWWVEAGEESWGW